MIKNQHLKEYLSSQIVDGFKAIFYFSPREFNDIDIVKFVNYWLDDKITDELEPCIISSIILSMGYNHFQEFILKILWNVLESLANNKEMYGLHLALDLCSYYIAKNVMSWCIDTFIMDDY